MLAAHAEPAEPRGRHEDDSRNLARAATVSAYITSRNFFVKSVERRRDQCPEKLLLFQESSFSVPSQWLRRLRVRLMQATTTTDRCIRGTVYRRAARNDLIRGTRDFGESSENDRASPS
jgi:hypothetical protein